MTARLVVVIPTKDRKHLLEKAVRSLLSQNIQDWRAIIVNDGSKDDTASYIERLAEEDSRISIINHEGSRGVNISRNEALAQLSPDEWGVLLDDDDELTKDALRDAVRILSAVPKNTHVVFFNTLIQTPENSFLGGYQYFKRGEKCFEPPYIEVLTKTNLRGDAKPVLRGRIFSEMKYRFSEDVNGFESEFYALLARDGVRMLYFPIILMHVNQSHAFGRLSHEAAVRDPGSFVRVHKRFLTSHSKILTEHPVVAMKRCVAALKVSIRSFDCFSFFFFLMYLLYFAGVRVLGSLRAK